MNFTVENYTGPLSWADAITWLNDRYGMDKSRIEIFSIYADQIDVPELGGVEMRVRGTARIEGYYAPRGS